MGAVAGHRLGQQRCIELRLSTSDFLNRIAALRPPPRKHRHRYFGVLASNSPWRALVMTQAARMQIIAALRFNWLLAGRQVPCEIA